MQEPLSFMRPISEWAARQAHPPLAPLLAAKRIGLDIESCDPKLKELGPGDMRTGFLAGISLAAEDGLCEYYPIHHEAGGNCNWDVISWLRSWAPRYTGTIVGANISYDLGFLSAMGIEFPLAKLRCIQVTEVLLDELRHKYSLNSVAAAHDLPGKDEGMLLDAAAAWKINPKSDLWRLHASFVGPYAEYDAVLPLQIARRQDVMIEEQDLQRVHEQECQLIPVLHSIRNRGIRVDRNKLAEIHSIATAGIATALGDLYSATGIRVIETDLFKAAALAPVLLKAGAQLNQTPKSKVYQVNDAALQSVPMVGTAILRARKFSKLIGTYCDSIERHLIGDRIHSVIHQSRKTDDGSGGEAGARFGRLSSAHPNGTNQPARDPEFGALWRSIYIAEDGEDFASSDYSQQEPRILVHYAEKLGLTGAATAANRYRDNPFTDFHAMMADITGLTRDNAKPIFLGKCYGMGGGKLCRSLGLPTVQKISKAGYPYDAAGPEGQAILDRFDREAPFVRELAKYAEEIAGDRGWIRNIDGRRCRFPRKDDGTYDWAHKALNRLIQGSAAAQTKQALIALHKAGYPVTNAIHDEVTASVADRRAAERAAEIMQDALPLKVPSVVKIKFGPSWGEPKITRVRRDGVWQDA